MRSKAPVRLPVLAGLTVLAAALVGCGGGGEAAFPGARVALRLGYFANITHAPGLLGDSEGLFTQKLGPDVDLQAKTFNAGPDVITALLSGAIDISYIGPNPAINGFAQSGGKGLRIIAGASSGGAFLVAKPTINAPSDLKGRKVATPQLGNTQDVALRAWLRSQGLSTTTAGGGDVSVVPQENAQTLETFKAGQIDAAWVPEPWATRLVQEAGAKVLVDERTLWPGGRYVTTHVIASTSFLARHPDVVKRFLEGHLAAVQVATTNPADARRLTNARIGQITTQPLKESVLAESWKNLTFTVDPVASSLRKSADDAIAVGLLKPVDLARIYDLGPLNDVLAAAGQPAVAA